MSDKKRRIKKLEQRAGQDNKPVIVVDWSTDDKPPRPGEVIVTWPEDDK